MMRGGAWLAVFYAAVFLATLSEALTLQGLVVVAYFLPRTVATIQVFGVCCSVVTGLVYDRLGSRVCLLLTNLSVLAYMLATTVVGLWLRMGGPALQLSLAFAAFAHPRLALLALGSQECRAADRGSYFAHATLVTVAGQEFSRHILWVPEAVGQIRFYIGLCLASLALGLCASRPGPELPGLGAPLAALLRWPCILGSSKVCHLPVELPVPAGIQASAVPEAVGKILSRPAVVNLLGLMLAVKLADTASIVGLIQLPRDDPEISLTPERHDRIANMVKGLSLMTWLWLAGTCMRRHGPKFIVQALLFGRVLIMFLAALSVGAQPLSSWGVPRMLFLEGSICLGALNIIALGNVVQVLLVSLVSAHERGTLISLSYALEIVPMRGLLQTAPLRWLLHGSPLPLWAGCAAVCAGLLPLVRRSHLMQASLKDE